MNLAVAGILAYVAAQFAIGAWVSRRIRTEADYLVAGRSLGYTLATFTIFATWFGAETTVGAAGAIYTDGLSGGSADPFGYALCLALMGAVFAVPLWKRGLTTVADLFRQRFSPGVEKVVVLLMVPTSLLWAAAQVRAFGQVLSAASGFQVELTIAFAALVVVAYTAFGGMLADAWTDVVQGIALMLGLGVVFAAVMADVGWGALREIDPARLALFGGADAGWMATLEAWAIPVFGSVMAAELVARVIAARSPRVARRSALGAAGLYLAFGMIPATLALLGSRLMPGLAEPEQLLPLLAERYLPAALYALFAGALVSAILSTVDSALLVASSLVSHNVVVALRPGMSEAAKVRVARVGVAVFGVVAFFLARAADGVYALVEEASAFGSAGIFVAAALGLFTGWGRAPAAYASLLAGVGTWVLGAHVLALPYPYLTSLGAALLAYAVLSAAGEREPAGEAARPAAG